MIDELQELRLKPEPIIDYESVKHTCYGLRFHKNKVIVTVNNKNTQEFLQTDFQNVDLNDLDQVSGMIDLIRSEGLQAFVNKFDLPMQE